MSKAKKQPVVIAVGTMQHLQEAQNIPEGVSPSPTDSLVASRITGTHLIPTQMKPPEKEYLLILVDLQRNKEDIRSLKRAISFLSMLYLKEHAYPKFIKIEQFYCFKFSATRQGKHINILTDTKHRIQVSLILFCCCKSSRVQTAVKKIH